MVNMLFLLSFLLQRSMLCFTCLIVVTLLGCITITLFHWYTQTVMVISSFSDCDILDKANYLSVKPVHVYNDAEITINITNNTRSRYSRFVYYNYRRVKLSSRRADREPSRIPTRFLKRLNYKSRERRRIVKFKQTHVICRKSQMPLCFAWEFLSCFCFDLLGSYFKLEPRIK